MQKPQRPTGIPIDPERLKTLRTRQLKNPPVPKSRKGLPPSE